MNKNINLLPYEVEEYKKTYRFKIFMVSLQIAIFMCIGIVVFIFSTFERSYLQRSQELIAQIEEIEELSPTRDIAAYFENFYARNFSTVFDSLWINNVMDTLPYSASIAQLRYIQHELFLEGEIRNAAMIEVHRRGLLEYFDYAWLGDISLQENGFYSYQLRIGVGNER